jgi:hypothetical protein
MGLSDRAVLVLAADLGPWMKALLLALQDPADSKLAAGGLAGLGERGRQGRDRRIDRDSGGQRVRVGPVEVTQGDAVERHPRVVLGGLKFARRFVKDRAAALGRYVDHVLSAFFPA